MEVKVRLDWIVSFTVTAPLVGPALDALLTTTLYTAPLSPCPKVPLWVFEILSTGPGMIVVESVALAVADPPPDTLTEFTWGDVALTATFTVTVIAG
jgi:hypothetical protein